MKKTERPKPEDILKLPYTQIVVPMEDGTFHAEMPDFPGCVATGETRAEALSTLQDVAESWLLSMIARDQPIPPPPHQEHDYSGRFVLRLPKTLHRQAAIAAQREGVSLNSYVSTCLAGHVGLQSGGFASPRLIGGLALWTQPTTDLGALVSALPRSGYYMHVPRASTMIAKEDA